MEQQLSDLCSWVEAEVMPQLRSELPGADLQRMETMPYGDPSVRNELQYAVATPLTPTLPFLLFTHTNECVHMHAHILALTRTPLVLQTDRQVVEEEEEDEEEEAEEVCCEGGQDSGPIVVEPATRL